MQLLSPADAAGRVTAALRSAAEATGAGFDYLLSTAQRESSLNPSAKAATSSARGLFQFIDQTWLQVLKEDGAKLGLSAEAADVTRSASGRYAVADPARRAELLALRDDPTAAALLAGAFTRRNAETLQSQLGRPATEGELYAAHFLGAQGAVDLIKLASAAPQASAADAFPAQASANRAIFYERGRERTAGEVYGKLTAGSGAAPPVAANTALALQETSQAEDRTPFNAGVEDDGRAFHSLFKTGRRSPVSAYVTQAWSSLGAAGLASDGGNPLRKVTATTSEPAEPSLAVARAFAALAPQAPADTRGAGATQTGAVEPKARSAAVAAAAATLGGPLDLASFRRVNLNIVTPAAPR